MDKEDYMDLIIVCDELDQLDGVLQMLAGFGHQEGRFKDLDKVYDVLQRHSKYYDENDDDLNDEFFHILSDKSKSLEERAELLMRNKTIHSKR